MNSKLQKIFILIFSFLLISSFCDADFKKPPIRPGTPAGIAKENKFTEWSPSLKPEPLLSKEEKQLMVQGLKWVDQNLKCNWPDDNNPPQMADGNGGWAMPDGKPMPQGRCYGLMGFLYGHFEDSSSLELILAISGGTAYLSHDVFYSDNQFVLCRLEKGVFSGKVIWKSDHPGGLEAISFKSGPDLIWIETNSSACVLKEDHGETRKLLEYMTDEADPQTKEGWYTRLIPLEKGDLQLLKLNHIGVDYDGRGHYRKFKDSVTEKIYVLDPAAGVYKTDEKEKSVSYSAWKNCKSKF